MKSFIKVFLISCLFLGLSSCALRDRHRPKADLQPIVTAEVDSSRRRVGLSEAEETQVKDPRRSVVIEKALEGDTLGEGFETEKSVTIFEPFDPERDKKEEEEVAEGGITKEIKEELLGITEEEEEYVTLNFEQAPIAEILNAVSETLGINFIMTPGVKGAITMQTSKPVPASELFQILQSVLEVNGLTLIPSGRYYKLVPGKEAKQYPIKVVSGKEGEELPPEDTFLTQIIPLDYIPVKDMQNILQPFLSKSAPPMIQHEELNIIIVNDLASNIKRLLRFVQELDKPLYQPKEKVYVYYVENGDAEKLASTLGSIYKDKDKAKGFPYSPLTGEKKQQEQQAGQQIIQTPFGPFMPSEQVSGEVSITADKEINALIIVTSPRNYPSVLETIKKLDIMPRQVLIEAMIVDVTLTDRFEFGLGWYLRGNLQYTGANFGSQNLGTFSSGSSGDFASWFSALGLGNTESQVDVGKYYDIYQNLRLSANVAGPEAFTDIFGYKLISDSGNFIAFMKMLSEYTSFNIVSSPYIMALDNQPATINITRQYPIPRVREVNAGTATAEFERTYDYKDVGLKLEVTPKINDSRMVNLEINQEVSEYAEEYQDSGQGIFNKREAKSQVVVQDGQTIVIGGLIQNTVSKSKAGIPFLSDIPVIGALFGGKKDVLQKTELLLFMTPHVVTSMEDVTRVTSDIENKIDSIKEIREGIREQEISR